MSITTDIDGMTVTTVATMDEVPHINRDDGTLYCPVCGNNNLHLSGIAAIKTENQDAVAVYFTCEMGCDTTGGKGMIFVLEGHKGIVFASWSWGLSDSGRGRPKCTHNKVLGHKHIDLVEVNTYVEENARFKIEANL